MNSFGAKGMGCALLAMSLVLVSCGGAGSGVADPTDSRAGAPASPSPASDGGLGATQYPMHPSIEDLPLLDAAEIPLAASAHSADVSPRETVAQLVVYRQGMREIFEFYFAELRAAGFVIVDGDGMWIDMTEFVEGSNGGIRFNDPDGHEGYLVFSHMIDGGVQMLINFHRAP